MLFITELKGKNKDFEYIIGDFIKKWKDSKFESDFDLPLSETPETYVINEMDELFKNECPYTDEDDICDYISKRGRETTTRTALERLLIKYNIEYVTFLLVDDDFNSTISYTSTITIKNPEVKNNKK